MFSIKQFLPRIKRYFSENLGAYFIIVFQALLVVCAGLLVQGDSGLANEVVMCAYYLLVVGVVLQLISFVRHGKGSKLEDDEG